MKRKIHPADKSGLKKAISSLRNCGIIAFPTDTVYGIGCDAKNRKVISRIFKLKGRSRKKPLVMFLAHSRSIQKYVVKPSKTRRKLLNKFCPGAVTFIMKAKKTTPEDVISKEGTVSIRIPGYIFLRKLIGKYGSPMATTSANPSGNSPAVKAKDLALDVDFVLSDDSIPGGIPSTILDISKYPFVLRRKGMISIFGIEKYIPTRVKLDKSLVFNILFVCSGNSCRSPMGESILKGLLKKKGLKNINVKSCGTLGISGLPPAENTVISAGELGYDIKKHRSQPLTGDIVRDSDLILCMENYHKKAVLDISPQSKDKVFLLTDYVGSKGEVDDPIGRDIGTYRKLAKKLERYAKIIVSDMEKRRNI